MNVLKNYKINSTFNLIKLGYAWEQATKARHKPKFLETFR